MINTVKELLEDSEVGTNRPKLESVKINHEKHQKELESLDREIAEKSEADAIEKEILERCEFEAALQEIISLVPSHLSFKESKNLEEQLPTPASASPISVIQQEASQNSPKANNKAKLPNLTLLKFAGDPTKWTTFWDSFSSAIHSNEGLNGVEKFQYLKSLLEGCAAETISGLPLTSSITNMRSIFSPSGLVVNKLSSLSI